MPDAEIQARYCRYSLPLSSEKRDRRALVEALPDAVAGVVSSQATLFYTHKERERERARASARAFVGNDRPTNPLASARLLGHHNRVF